MTFDGGYALQILPIILRASIVTLEATIGGMSLALVMGVVLAVGRLSSLWPLRAILAVWVDFVRTTPLLVQLYFLFYILPRYGITLPALVTGVLALGVHYSSYISEVYRAGIQGVSRGQWDAAAALNLSPVRTWFSIIFPQAIPPVIPALGNNLLAMFKDTPLLASITVIELLGQATTQASITFRYLEPISIVGLIFLLFGIPSSLLVEVLERRYGRT